jgi:hypothetical protein
VIVKFTFMSRIAVKFMEVAGAGIASALCAYFLGQIERPPAPATAVVQIAPATVENAARETRVAVVVPSTANTQPERATITPAAAATPKSAKSASVAPARRNQKSEPGVAAAEAKARTGEPLAIDPHGIAPSSARKTTAQNVPTAPAERDEPAAWGSDEESPLLARLKLIPSWFLPDNDRIFGDLPRPPMPVGESLRSAM